MYDGKIIFNTKIDNSRIDKDLKRLEQKIRKSEETIAKNKNAKLPLESRIKALQQEIEDIEHSQYRKMRAAPKYYDENNEVNLAVLDKAKKDLASVNGELKKVNDQIDMLERKRSPIADDAKRLADQHDVEVRKLEELRAKYEQARKRAMDALMNSGSRG